MDILNEDGRGLTSGHDNSNGSSRKIIAGLTNLTKNVTCLTEIVSLSKGEKDFSVNKDNKLCYGGEALSSWTDDVKTGISYLPGVYAGGSGILGAWSFLSKAAIVGAATNPLGVFSAGLLAFYINKLMSDPITKKQMVHQFYVNLSDKLTELFNNKATFGYIDDGNKDKLMLASVLFNHYFRKDQSSQSFLDKAFPGQVASLNHGSGGVTEHEVLMAIIKLVCCGSQCPNNPSPNVSLKDVLPKIFYTLQKDDISNQPNDDQFAKLFATKLFGTEVITSKTTDKSTQTAKEKLRDCFTGDINNEHDVKVSVIDASNLTPRAVAMMKGDKGISNDLTSKDVQVRNFTETESGLTSKLRGIS
jgi:hypothetical protein